MKIIPVFDEDATLADYLTEPITREILRHYTCYQELDIERYDPESGMVKHAETTLDNIYYTFKSFTDNIDDPEHVFFLFQMNDSKLHFMPMLLDYYEVPPSHNLEKILTSLYNFSEQYDIEMIDEDYFIHKFDKIQGTFNAIKSQKDTKDKLRNIIQFKQDISWLYFANFKLTAYNYLMQETEMIIGNLKEMDDLGFLPSIAPKIPKNNQMVSIRSSFRHKTDIIKILSAMYDAKMFAGEDGKPLTNKQKLMDAFGEFLGEDFSAYSASLSQAKNRDEKTFLKPFKEIEKEALRYFNALGE